MINAFYYQLKYFLRNKINSRYPDSDWLYQHYAGKDFWDTDTVNRRVADMITSGTPFMMGRFGAVELFNMRTAEFHLNSKAAKACEQLSVCAGFFPDNPKFLPQFNEVMKDACRQTDILGIWLNSCEDYYIKNYCPDLKATCKLLALEPWRSKVPWSAALKGKKVLIIHPFEDSIQSQYQNQDKLFPGTDILPQFELKTLKAVQTAGNSNDTRFSDWFEALDWMCKECEDIDFDIALLGCGAYGYPLAAHIKKMGKQAIHMGGCLQILFGLKGRRWDEGEPDVVAMYNEYWHYPMVSEIPKGSGDIEGGTYWKKEDVEENL